MGRVTVLGALLGLSGIALGVVFAVRPALLSTYVSIEVLAGFDRDLVVIVLGLIFGTYVLLLTFIGAGTTAEPRVTETLDADQPPTADTDTSDDRETWNAGEEENPADPVEYRNAADHDAGTDAGEISRSGTESVHRADSEPGPDGESDQSRRYVPGSPDVFERLRADPPETVTEGTPVTGQQFDELVAEALQETSGTTPAAHAQTDILETLRELAVWVEQERTGLDRENVVRAVETGDWTDDRLAAAFLAEEGAVSFPFPNRISAWLDPEGAFVHRLARTVAAIEDRFAEMEDGG